MRHSSGGGSVMGLFLLALVALVSVGSTVVTLAWVVPAVSDVYFGREAHR
jgi:hypothetical protein